MMIVIIISIIVITIIRPTFIALYSRFCSVLCYVTGVVYLSFSVCYVL